MLNYTQRTDRRTDGHYGKPKRQEAIHRNMYFKFNESNIKYNDNLIVRGREAGQCPW